MPKVNESQRWKTPQYGSFKINVDVVVPLRGDMYSIGMVNRDQSGCFFDGKVVSRANLVYVFEGEAMVIGKTLTWVIEKQYDNISIESDSFSCAVFAINNNVVNFLDEVGDILEAAEDYLHLESIFSITY